MKEYYDVIVIGTGIAGLNTCINLDKRLKVLLLAKDTLSTTNTSLAQGGIATARDNEDIDRHIQDTLKAGKFHNDSKAVRVLVEESFKSIKSIMDIGVVFDKSNSHLHFTREGGHSAYRILHVKDKTGRYISKSMFEAISLNENIDIYDHTSVLDIIIENGACTGVVLKTGSELRIVNSKVVMMASGGVGGLFKSSTNQAILRGEGIGIAFMNNVALKDMSFIQFHPTALYDGKTGNRKFLITEALRGEGALLFNINGERFVDELSPRDIVCDAIKKQTRNSTHVLLDISFKDKDFILRRFPLVHSRCLEQGIDITKEPIPVLPAQHYMMGGIEVDTFCRSNLPNFYASGETACTGVHGKNRLASNSLLEGLVFSKRACDDINKRIRHIDEPKASNKALSPDYYHELDTGALVKEEIKRRTERYNDEFK
ncbi:L-aspartate oxidase [Alkalibacter saccharofermentans]|uniref:L-aspartate oxidase n=1 Tax=Alkalibacter saccharofermentans DSM 14828 TaxID=1120975 RepID=A0A1M4TMU8_9FIRM|nr:L-aspartate oxidase [Alkalibacter saccharofermentans]SHE45768.1 L-aspartate oxidase [Alkalibacter saccharofermentans DSM 14828]